MTDEELAWTPAWRLREMFQAGTISPLEFAEYLLDRIDRHAELGAFIRRRRRLARTTSENVVAEPALTNAEMTIDG